uniref:Polyketide synthase n=1 Tax=Peronospora matthiolae TaxID=2874970 RepID=A0AAV1VGY1_9STRA
MRDTSSLGAVTHRDCVLGAIFVKSPANSLEVAGSAGFSALTDPARFLAVRLAVADWRHGKTHVSDPSLAKGGHHVLSSDVLQCSGHYTHERSVQSSDSGGILPFACDSESESSRSRCNRGPLDQDLLFPVASSDDSWTS